MTFAPIYLTEDDRQTLWRALDYYLSRSFHGDSTSSRRDETHGQRLLQVLEDLRDDLRPGR